MSVLTERLMAEVFDSPDAAAAVMLGVLETIPPHYDVSSFSIWRYSTSVGGGKAGKWTWRFHIGAEVGGYSRQFKDDDAIRAERRVAALLALTEARDAAHRMEERDATRL